MHQSILRTVIVLTCWGMWAGCQTNGAAGPEALSTVGSGASTSGTYNVRTFGASGDGETIDSPAINKAIDVAAANGGGTIFFPPGTYACYTIRLKSNIRLHIDQGATILAADPPPQQQGGGYDAPEPNEWGDVWRYQDFGHTHWKNSLIWGEGLENISIMGPGMIDGRGLTRGGLPRGWYRNPATAPWARGADSGVSTQPTTRRGGDEYTSTTAGSVRFPPRTGLPGDWLPPGVGNKSIALRLCRNVIIRDLTVYRGGHFCILATGVDNLTIDNCKFDTGRDGFNIDCCRNVRISNCFVNSPGDDGICLKSSFALGYARPTENVTITNCQVSGYEVGSYLDGTYRRRERGSPTGRIKFGTESNGGFRNITISNCVFEHCRGFALESVDGSLLEDVTITNITMRDIVNSPIFLRLGARMRGPEGVPVGTLRRVIISNIVCYDASPNLGCIISGIPGHYIEDVKLDNIRIYYRGGGTREMATTQPRENETGYPEPTMFGRYMPSYGMFIRHAKDIEISNVQLSYVEPEHRSPFVLEDVKGATFRFVEAQHEPEVAVFQLKDVEKFATHECAGLADTKRDKVETDKLTAATTGQSQ